MSRYGTPYRDCIKLQKALAIKALDATTEARDANSSVKAWIELEYLKREIKGIPRLAPHSLKELMDTKQRAMRQLPSSSNYQPYTELTESERQAEAKGKTVWEE
jgi:hypothetical protein